MRAFQSIRTRSGLRWITAAGLLFGAFSAHASDAPDLDGDGIPNIVDPDIDSDGIPNALDDNVDGGIAKSGPYAGQYIGDHLNNDNPAEKDIDDDDLSDDSLGETDIDGDSKTDDDPTELDIDGDRRMDRDAWELDIDGDGRLDDSQYEDDIDGDSLDDDDLSELDIDGDDSPDTSDEDIDGDNLANSGDIDDDSDGDGIPNAEDDDADGDGLGNRDDDDDDNDGRSDEDDSDHHHEEDELEIEINLTPTANAPGGSRIKLEVQRMATGKIELELEGRHLAGGFYDVVVDNNVIGQLYMKASGSESEGEVQFETDANDEDEIPLLIDPIGLPISIVRDGTTYFTGIVPTPPDAPDGGDGGGDGSGSTTTGVDLERSPGTSTEAESHAELQFGLAGVVALEIEVENAPVGSYELVIGGSLRGTFGIERLDGGTRGEIRFKAVPEGSGELPLDFRVAGEPVEINLQGTTIFSGTLPSGS